MAAGVHLSLVTGQPEGPRRRPTGDGLRMDNPRMTARRISAAGFSALCVLGLSIFLAAGPSPFAGEPVKALHGAGATFPYPLYAAWSHRYKRLKGVAFNYQSIGSGGGIRQIKFGTTDYGASEAPLSEQELKTSGLIQFPMVIGGVVPVVNLDGVPPDTLRLTGPVLADIFLGVIKNWHDPRIMQLNPGLKLPRQEISVVTRADGSGTTWLFTHYLSQISSRWASEVGRGTSVRWPVGMGGKGNEGVAAYIRQVRGSIGYLELVYARQTGLSTAVLRNRAGRFVSAGRTSFTSALAEGEWNRKDLTISLTDRPGDDTWPITGASYILIYERQPSPDKARALLDFFHWCLTDGASLAEKMDYVPVPPRLVDLIEATWREDVTARGRAVWPPVKRKSPATKGKADAGRG